MATVGIVVELPMSR